MPYAFLKYWRGRNAELDAQISPGFVQIEEKQVPMPSGNTDSGAAAMAFLPKGARMPFNSNYEKKHET